MEWGRLDEVYGEADGRFVAVGRVSLRVGGFYSDWKKVPPEQILTFQLYQGRLHTFLELWKRGWSGRTNIPPSPNATLTPTSDLGGVVVF